MLKYYHVDVFTQKPMGGNGLAVVFPGRPLPDAVLLEITREFRQFETIFIFQADSTGVYPVRIFTVDEELQFAGHPLIGAGAVVHSRYFSGKEKAEIVFGLGERQVLISSQDNGGHFRVTMNQGEARFINTVPESHYKEIAASINLNTDDLNKDYSIEVVSTGLPYLLVPLRKNISACKIVYPDFESFLSGFGAKFIYVFETDRMEARTWDNIAHTEDAATGSAAGPLCAYLVKNNIREPGKVIEISQGRFIGRPSVIRGWVSDGENSGDVFIQGDVAFFASGTIRDNVLGG